MANQRTDRKNQTMATPPMKHNCKSWTWDEMVRSFVCKQCGTSLEIHEAELAEALGLTPGQPGCTHKECYDKDGHWQGCQQNERVEVNL